MNRYWIPFEPPIEPPDAWGPEGPDCPYGQDWPDEGEYDPGEELLRRQKNEKNSLEEGCFGPELYR